MSDPYGPPEGLPQPYRRSRHEPAWEPANQAGQSEQVPDAWAEIYGWQEPPKPTGPPGSLRGVAWAASALISLTAVLDVLIAWDFFARAPQASPGGQSYYGVEFGYFIATGDSLLRAVSVASAMAAAALFITWQYKHARNAERLGQRGGLGAGWAIGGWFIPLANFVLPAVQLTQSSSASDPPPDKYRGESRTLLVVGWAVVFYVSLFAVRVISPDQDAVRTADVINGLLAMMSVPAALLAVHMIWELTKRQEGAFDARHSP